MCVCVCVRVCMCVCVQIGGELDFHSCIFSHIKHKSLPLDKKNLKLEVHKL